MFGFLTKFCAGRAADRADAQRQLRDAPLRPLLKVLEVQRVSFALVRQRLHRRPLRCGERLRSTVPGQGTRALQLWRNGRPPPFARSNAWVEADRSRSTAGPAPGAQDALQDPRTRSRIPGASSYTGSRARTYPGSWFQDEKS